MRRVLAAAILMLATAGAAMADSGIDAVPAQTPVRFHLTETISSNQSKSGTPFTFVLLDPIVIGTTALVPSGATGTGTLVLAGHAGTSGHEGDLTLRLDTIQTSDGRTILFEDQQLRINGHNKKIMAGVLGFIPYAGLGARFIRGADVRIDPETPIVTMLEHPAPLDARQPVALEPASGAQQTCVGTGCGDQLNSDR
jgi:hypothetical protein